jgi:hypothetical protein
MENGPTACDKTKDISSFYYGTYTDRNYSTYFWTIIGRTIRVDLNKDVMSDAVFFLLCINVCSSISTNYLFILKKKEVLNAEGQRF